MRELPRVKISYGNDALAQAIASADGLLCLVVVGATAIEGKFDLAKQYPLNKLTDADDLGIAADTNALAYKLVQDFYTEAAEGTKTYLVGYPSTLSMSDVLNKDNPYLRNIHEATNGEIRGFFVTAVSAESPTITDGFDSNMEAAKLNAQTFGEWATFSRYAPVFTILDGLNYSGAEEEVPDLTLETKNRVGILVGATASGSANQSIGLLAGRIASSPVQRNPGRNLDGPLNVLEMYCGDKTVEQADIATLHGKGYITFTTYTGMTGYFITDDPLATKETDDYNEITRRRTIDKAYRIAYATMVEQLKDEIPVNIDGTMMETYARAFELKVERAIANNMTANGELSADPSDSTDRGVVFTIDRTNNVLGTSKILSVLRVRPFGYGKYIDVVLGFTIIQA